MLQTIELGSRIKVEVDAAPAGMPLFVSIVDEKGRRSDYWVSRIPSDWGIACRFSKIWDGKAKDFDHRDYDVMLDTVSWLHSCDCKGACRYGRCKHTLVAIALHDAGLLLLPAETRREEPAPAERGELTYGPEFPEDAAFQALVGVEVAEGYEVGGILFDNP